MRIDLEGGRRPLRLRLLLRFIQWQVGFRPAPILWLTYNSDFFSSTFRGYMMRGMRGCRWSKGESELIGAFVSSLNSCHF